MVVLSLLLPPILEVGDSTKGSESIKNSIETLSDNSDLMLPLTSAMLSSLRSIESSIGSVANLIARGNLSSSIAESISTGTSLTGIGALLQKADIIQSLAKFDPIKILQPIASIGINLLNTVLGGLFGKTTTSVTASGLYAGNQKLGDVLANGFSLLQYADVTKKTKSWFSSSSSSSTVYSGASDELANQFTLIFSSFLS